jgi:hypothetical protein
LEKRFRSNSRWKALMIVCRRVAAKSVLLPGWTTDITSERKDRRPSSWGAFLVEHVYGERVNLKFNERGVVREGGASTTGIEDFDAIPAVWEATLLSPPPYLRQAPTTFGALAAKPFRPLTFRDLPISSTLQ